MANLTLDVSGLQEIEAALGRALSDAGIQNIIRPGVVAILAVGQEHLAQSPQNGPVYPIRWKSEKQRRFVMAKLRREGNLPYTRHGSGGVMGGWTHKTEDVVGGVRGVLGNNVPYAIFVQGEHQQPFHEDTGWHTTAEAIEKMKDIAQKAMDIAISAGLRSNGL